MKQPPDCGKLKKEKGKKQKIKNCFLVFLYFSTQDGGKLIYPGCF
jgi:hypothetical protein